MKTNICLAVITLLFTITSCNRTAAEGRDPIRLIIETDMGNDIDDALALDLVYKAMDTGAVDILGISHHKKSDYASEYIDILNTWYGYANIPIAKAAQCIENTEATDYTKLVCELKVDGRPAFLRTKSANDVAESVTFYRKTLSAQNDHSVTILSLGFGTTLACLLDSDPDAYSALSGRELVAQKVCLLAIMAGSFGENMRAEFNVVNDRSSMQQLFATWNTPIVLAPFELGKKVQYPASAIENSFGWTSLHPVVEGYKCYCQMPYDRATWDLMPFIWLLHPDFFTTSDAGKITIDDNAYTHFTPDASSNHVWLDATPTQAEVLKAYILAESTRPPHKYAR